jgi:hypothetical protein
LERGEVASRKYDDVMGKGKKKKRGKGKKKGKFVGVPNFPFSFISSFSFCARKILFFPLFPLTLPPHPPQHYSLSPISQLSRGRKRLLPKVFLQGQLSHRLEDILFTDRHFWSLSFPFQRSLESAGISLGFAKR